MASTPLRSGIGLRTPHYGAVLTAPPPLGFVEVHSENFFGRCGGAAGGQPLRLLERIRAEYPLSLHGVGLSLGSAEPVRCAHLRQLRELVALCEPLFVSDHLAWIGIDGVYLNDLLPLPYTEEALALAAANIDTVQDALGRQLLIENPSRYLAFAHSTMSEGDFLSALVAATGCGILLDLNNIYVSAHNLGLDPVAEIASIDADAVMEIHLAGFSRSGDLLIDSHDGLVDAAVWDFYRRAIKRFPHAPTLIEWDVRLPAVDVLLAEAARADRERAMACNSGVDHVVAA